MILTRTKLIAPALVLGLGLALAPASCRKEEPLDVASAGPRAGEPSSAAAAAAATASDPEPDESLPADAPRIDVAFCMDATGSMGGVIERAKTKIEEIAAWMRRGMPKPRVRYGLVIFRDRGDGEVVKNFGFFTSPGAMKAALGEVVATGGGDLPEHVVAGLRAAVNDLPWDEAAVLRALFLIGDAEPHLDYGADSDPKPVLEAARKKKIVVSTIACGDMTVPGHRFWKEVAEATGGANQSLPGTSGTPALAEMELEEAVYGTLRGEAEKAGVHYAGGEPVPDAPPPPPPSASRPAAP
jgi:hypothetical protein